MLLNLRLDGCSLHILCSTKTLPISPLDKFPSSKKVKQNYVPVTYDSDKGLQRTTKHGERGSSERGSNTVANEVVAGKDLLFVNPGNTRVRKSESSDGFMNKRGGDGGFGGIGMVGKVHTKCSTKRLSYGGCIPVILEALDCIEDVEDTLSPWADRLCNKERTIILKDRYVGREQSRYSNGLRVKSAMN